MIYNSNVLGTFVPRYWYSNISVDPLNKISVKHVKNLVKEIHDVVNPKDVYVLTGAMEDIDYVFKAFTNTYPNANEDNFGHVQIKKSTEGTLIKTDKDWLLGTMRFSSEEVNKLFADSMKDKIMFIVPSRFKDSYKVKVTDSPIAVLAIMRLMDVVDGGQVWENMNGKSVQFELYSERVRLLPEEEPGEKIPLTFSSELFPKLED